MTYFQRLATRPRAVCFNFSICLLAAIILSGCQSRDAPPLGKVSGVVTLDGVPLPHAKVEFQPEEDGSPSIGKTDAEGKYTLEYAVDLPGALIGNHKIRITTFRQEYDPDGGPPTEFPERVPPQYNSASNLVREVTSGKQTHDFQLEGGLSVN